MRKYKQPMISSSVKKWDTASCDECSVDEMEKGSQITGSFDKSFRTHSKTEVKSHQNNKKDDRLFPELPLYCEGLNKPVLRGVIHLFATLFLIFHGFSMFYTASRGNKLAKISSIIFVGSNINCYGTSALYHIGRWPAHVEIILQKMDHCGIAILSAGTMMPVAFTLLPVTSPYLGIALGIYAAGLSAWVCHYIIFIGQASTFRQVVAAASIVPFIPWLWYLMTPWEYRGMLGCMAFQAMGVAVFTTGRPDPLPSIFGHHEIFHFFVTCAGLCAFLTNYSVIYRMSSTNDEDSYVPMDHFILYLILFYERITTTLGFVSESSSVSATASASPLVAATSGGVVQAYATSVADQYRQWKASTAARPKTDHPSSIANPGHLGGIYDRLNRYPYVTNKNILYDNLDNY